MRTRPLRLGRLSPRLGGCFPLHYHWGVSGGCRHFGRHDPDGWGDASLSAAIEAMAAVEVEDTAAVPITCAAPLRVMAPTPTSPEEDASRSSGVPAKGVTAVTTSEGATIPVGDEADLVTSATPRRVVAPAPTAGEDAPRTLRRSSRNEGRADKHTLLKVERLAKKKNLEGISFSEGSDGD
jgi:hypothetical protein